MRKRRQKPLSLLIGCALFSGMSGAVTAGETWYQQKQDPFEAARKDPRSSALLNVLAARGAGKPSNAQLPRPAYVGFHSTVNDTAADASRYYGVTQSTTSVVDLGGGNLLAAFGDSGSWYETGISHTGWAWSNNNGFTWNDGGALSNSTNNPGEGDGGNPVLAVNTTAGSVYLSVNGYYNPNKLWVFKSIDLGHTWGTPRNAAPGFASGNTIDKAWIAVDNFAGAGQGNVYACWTLFASNGAQQIRFTKSTDGGTTFGPTPGTVISPGGHGCFVAVSPNHQINLFYYKGTGAGGEGGDNKIFLRRSTDGGATFSAEVQVADLNTTTNNGDLGVLGGFRTNSFPQVAINPVAARPYIYVVYNDKDTVVANKSEIYYVRSLDGGATWSAPAKVNDDAAGDQFFPTVAFAPGGEQLMFGYYSRSWDPANSSFHRRGRHAALDVSGNVVTAGQSFAVSPSTPIVIGRDGYVNAAYMGDYDTIAGGSGQFATVWSDNRLRSTYFLNQPDVRFARIASPPPSSDLAVSIAASATSVALGNPVSFTVTASATGGQANDVFLHIPTIIAGLATQSVFTASGQCSNINGVVDCYMGSIPAGASKTVQVTAVAVLGAGTRTLRAQGTTSSADTNAANNSALASVTVTAGSAVSSSYSSGDLTVIIPDYGSSPAYVDVPIAVPDEGNVLNIAVSVRMNHTFDSDMRVQLIAPTGQTVLLANRQGGSGQNFGSGANSCSGAPTVFDDAAATSILSGSPPYAGTFRPFQSITSQTALAPTDGVWKLRFTDLASGNQGVVGCVSLNILRNP